MAKKTEKKQTKKKTEVKPLVLPSCMEEIQALIRARVPIIWVQTHEESRFIKDFASEISSRLNRQIWVWSGYQGLHRYGAKPLAAGAVAGGEENQTENPKKVLKYIADLPAPKKGSSIKGNCFVLRDFHTVLNGPIPRQLRDVYTNLVGTSKTLVVVSPVLAHGADGCKEGLPPTLEKQVAVIRYELPEKEQIRKRVEGILRQVKDASSRRGKPTKTEYTEEELQSFVRALQGLTMSEVDDAVSTSITHLDEISVQWLINTKRQILRKSEILEFVGQVVSMDDVGGLDQAKDYLSKYAQAYSDEAKKYGVEPLKGLLLTGIPGSGKSLLAKAIGALWKMPLLRLDVGKVMTGLVGGSEEKMRMVIKQTEAMAPTLLWIDEVEKSLAGTKSSNFSDGGTLARVFGTLLTAMQEGLEGVTVVATANDITMLPPEFIRRFNEVFFVDLPGPEERWEIFEIHLRKRGRDFKRFEEYKEELLAASDDYTGAEIEKAVKDAVAAAFHDKADDVTHEHITKALEETKPIAKVMQTKINKIREKARGQYRYASQHAEEQSKVRKVKSKQGKELDLNEALDDFDEITQTPKEKGEDVEKGSEERFENIGD
jgi:SpoVK/Ycf46/Vps4 family AAA+-type ATPase